MVSSISKQKSRWGNIKTSSYIWKRSWKQVCTANWYLKSYTNLMWNMYCSITLSQTVSPLPRYKQKDGKLRLMKNVWWEYDKLPHMLIAGGTGGGKTYFILIIEALLRCNAVMYVLDPKNADLADLAVVMPEVYYKKEDITACIDRFYDGMMERNESMKRMANYKTGENYAYLGLAPHFLIFDEYVAFMEMLTTKENAAVLNKLKQIVMLGRQAGYFLILACQRPDAKYLGDGIRDQFNFRVALGRMSELGYSMMFGEVDKDFFLKQIKGRGYVDTGTSVISEFYTPLVPKVHDFLKEIGKLSQNRQDGQTGGVRSGRRRYGLACVGGGKSHSNQ